MVQSRAAAVGWVAELEAWVLAEDSAMMRRPSITIRSSGGLTYRESLVPTLYPVKATRFCRSRVAAVVWRIRIDVQSKRFDPVEDLFCS